MCLPNANRARVDQRKLVDYCLSPTHPVGKHKARVFRAVFGWTAADADELRKLLLVAAASETAISGAVDEFGIRYEIDFLATNAVGSAIIRSA